MIPAGYANTTLGLEGPVNPLSNWYAALGEILFTHDYVGSGVAYVCTDVTGWDTISTTGEVANRTYADGGWVSAAFRAPKGLTLVGEVVCDDPSWLRPACDQLVDSLPLSVPSTLVVTQDEMVRQMTVILDGDAEVAVDGPRSASFSIPLVAPDPYKYAVAQDSVTMRLPKTSGGWIIGQSGLAYGSVPMVIAATVISGSRVVSNAGTAPTFPLLRITGPVDFPTVTNATTGQRLTYNGSLADGEYVDVDTARRTVLLNGTATRRGLMSGSWWVLGPGSSEIDFNSATYSPDASLTLWWRSAWK